MQETQYDSKGTDELEIDLREYVKIIFKWKWLIIAITILAVGTSAIMSIFILPPVYKTKAMLLVRQASDNRSYARQNDISNIEDVVDTVSSISRMTIQSYVNQVKNETVLNNVINSLGLDKDLYNAQSLGGMIQVSAISDTNFIEISVTNSDPHLATKIANSLSQEYVKHITQTIQKQMNQSVIFLNELITEEDIALDKVSDNLRDFQSQAKSTNFLASEVQSITENLADYRSKYYGLQIDVESLQVAVDRLESQAVEIPETLIREEVLPATETTEAKVIEVQEPNPEYNALIAKLQDKQVQLTQKQAEMTSVQDTIAELQAEMVGLQAELADKKGKEASLERELARHEQTYAVLSEKLTQSQLAQSVDIGQNTLQVISPATTPINPIKPNKKLNIAIAFVLGLMISVFIVFLLEFFDTSVKSADDLQKRTGLTVLGSIPNHDYNG